MGRCALRHARRARSHKRGGPSATYQSVLGALLVEQWHSQLGIATVSGNVDTWTGQTRGIVLQAPAAAQRPVYAADGTNFKAKSVVQCAVTGNKCLLQLTAISPQVFASGSRPWIGLFGRMRAYGASQSIMFAVLDNPITALLAGIESFPAPNITSVFGGSGALISDNSTAVRLVSGSLDAAGVNTASVNGVVIGTNGTGLTLSAAAKTLTLGANTAGNFPADLSACAVFLCSAQPSAAQLTSLMGLLQAEFGPF